MSDTVKIIILYILIIFTSIQFLIMPKMREEVKQGEQLFRLNKQIDFFKARLEKR